MISLRIRLEIFSPESIEQAVAAYNRLAKIHTCFEGEFARLDFFDCKFDEYRTIKEFENYLISIENS